MMQELWQSYLGASKKYHYSLSLILGLILSLGFWWQVLAPKMDARYQLQQQLQKLSTASSLAEGDLGSAPPLPTSNIQALLPVLQRVEAPQLQLLQAGEQQGITSIILTGDAAHLSQVAQLLAASRLMSASLMRLDQPERAYQLKLELQGLRMAPSNIEAFVAKPQPERAKMLTPGGKKRVLVRSIGDIDLRGKKWCVLLTQDERVYFKEQQSC